MPLQVIGAGFGRTGTMSLKAALEQLGFGPCYHMVEGMPRGPAHWKLWEDAVAGNADWDAIFDGFSSGVDFPVCSSYGALAEAFPDSKVILTTRDPQKWFDSTQDTIFAPHWMEYLREGDLGRFVHATINDHFDDRMHDRDHLIARFHEHNEEVRARIPAERLLEFEVGQGWEPLCAFLGVPVPEGDFPFINDADATRGIINKIIEEGPEIVFGYTGH